MNVATSSEELIAWATECRMLLRPPKSLTAITEAKPNGKKDHWEEIGKPGRLWLISLFFRRPDRHKTALPALFAYFESNRCSCEGRLREEPSCQVESLSLAKRREEVDGS